MYWKRRKREGELYRSGREGLSKEKVERTGGEGVREGKVYGNVRCTEM